MYLKMPLSRQRERIKNHSAAFDGLLSLIPAKYYYDDATQDQWQQQKKSKKELQEYRRAKLDPESKDGVDEYSNALASAKDVMVNKASTAKNVTLPSPKFSKVITEESDDDVEIPDMEVSDGEEEDEEEKEEEEAETEAPLIGKDTNLIFDDEGNEIEHEDTPSKSKTGKAKASPEEQKKRQENLARLREKLSDKISKLREKRKAPGSNAQGAPQSREQILADRKKKEEQKRLEKLKRKSEHIEDEDEDEDDDDDDEDDNDESDTEANDKVLFGNIVFNDGSRVTSDLKKLRNTAEKQKQKGPANNDIKAHLQKLEAKKRRISQLTPEEQVKQKEKDQWKRAMAQAEGVKIKDDEKLLKKALKRKERQKLKSEIEWKERKQIVKDTVAARAKRREENLKARKDNKGKKSKHQPKLRKFTGTVNKSTKTKKRAGFEGSAKVKKQRK